MGFSEKFDGGGNEDHKMVDLNTAEMKGKLQEGQIYKKQGKVNAVQAEGGEEIVTELADGTKETTNVAEKGDWIITNPDGEQYIIKDEKFKSRYEATEEDGVYAAKGYIRAIKNPYNEPIQHTASWGEIQKGSADSMVAIVCDENGDFDPNEHPYIIAPNEFANTYKPAEKK